MKAKLENPELEYRGVELEAETDEEKEVLSDIWENQGGPAMFSREGGVIKLIISPYRQPKDG